MNCIILSAIFFSIIYALTPDRKHEKQAQSKTKFLGDQWEEFIPEGGQPERPWSIEILSSKNYPVTQKLEAFSLN